MSLQPNVLEDQPEGTFQVFFESKPGIIAVVALAILTLLCLCLCVANIMLIKQRLSKRNELINVNED